MSLFSKQSMQASKNRAKQTETVLYVPKDYKEQAKKLGAQFNWDTKKWYTLDTNENRQKLVDIFHESNFVTSFHGERMKSSFRTEKQRNEFKIEKAKQKEYKERYNDYKNDIIEMYGKFTDQNERNFNEWYSVNFLHE